MDRDRKTYIAWLNNSYAMELGFARMYDMHAKDAVEFPELRAKLEAHAEESRKHAKMMAGCIRRNGATPNPAKRVLGDISGMLLGLTGDVTIDKVIMNNLTDSGIEQFEIVAYETVRAGAERFGDRETVAVAESILADERAMAAWLEEQAPRVAREFLELTAKRPGWSM